MTTTSATAVPVPVAAPSRLSEPEEAAVRAAILGVLESGPWVGGGVVSDFETAFANASGIPHLVGTGNGTEALAIAMASLELPRGSCVLVAANEGGYSATAARMSGLVPIAMDVAQDSMEPNVENADRAWRADVSAIVVTHLHGDAVELGALDSWRRERGIALIEDCAQAHGAQRDGHRVGTTGDAAAFSFYPTKNLGTIGDAGAVGFRESRAAERARSLAQYGWGERHRSVLAGGRNSRLDPVHAAVLSARLPWLAERNARRRSIANRYRVLLAEMGVALLGRQMDTVAHHAVAVTSHRASLAAHLRSAGISTAVHYPFVLSEMPGLSVEGSATPNAELWRDRILSLPCFPELRDDEVDRVCSALLAWRIP